MKVKPMLGTGDPRPPDDPEQSKRFKEKALEIEADEDGRSFTDALNKAVPVKPPVVKRLKEATSTRKNAGKS